MLATLGGMRRAAASDLSQLAALTSRSLLRGSAFAAARLGLGAGGPAAAKTAVALSPYAHDLLMRWLHTGGGRMLPLLSVVNSCLDLQVGGGGGGGGGRGLGSAGPGEGSEVVGRKRRGGARMGDCVPCLARRTVPQPVLVSAHHSRCHRLKSPNTSPCPD